MTNRRFISTAMMLVLMLSATASFGQNKELRIPLKGNAYAVGAAGAAGLEIGGKLVVPKNYASFQTDGDGTMFAVEAKDGKWGVVNRSGTFIYKCTYYKAQITGNMIRLQATANEEPKFYNVKTPTTEIKVTRVDALTFEPGTKKLHELAEQRAREFSAVNPSAAFELRENAKGNHELWVKGSYLLKEYQTAEEENPALVKVENGKKLFEARAIQLISDTTYFRETTCLVFEVSKGNIGLSTERGGIFTVYIYEANGTKCVDTFLSAPMEFSYIGNMCDHYVSATTESGAEFSVDVRNGKKSSWMVISRCRDERKEEAERLENEEAAKNAAIMKADSQVTLDIPTSSSTATAANPPTTSNPPIADVSKEVYDRKITPEVKAAKANVTLKEIAIGQNYTRIKLVYVAGNMPDCFYLYRPYDPRGYYLEANGKNYYMVAQKGMKYYDEGRTCVNIKESLTLYLYFEALPEDVKKINLVEEEGIWVFYNVELKSKKKGFFDKLNDALDQVDEVLDQVDKVMK